MQAYSDAGSFAALSVNVQYNTLLVAINSLRNFHIRFTHHWTVIIHVHRKRLLAFGKRRQKATTRAQQLLRWATVWPQ